MSIGIYKITSPSNKIYIGQSINIEKRFKQYKRLDCKKQPKLFNSLKKYGPENHKFEILEECSVNELNFKETFYKSIYDTVTYGLNCELFDIGQGPRSKKVRNKISKTLTGKKKTQEHCYNLSQAKLGTPSKRKGKPDLKQKGVPKPGAGGKNKPKVGAGPKEGKHVINIETNEIFYSVKECMEKLGFHKKQMYLMLKDPNSKIKYKV